MKHWFVFALLVFGFQATEAQRIFTLQDCLAQALQRNIRVRQSALTLESAGIDLRGARGLRLPSLNGSASLGYNFGRNVDPFTNTFVNTRIQSNSFSLSTGVVLFNGLQVNNQIRQKETDLKTSQFDQQTAETDLMLQVASQYLQILLQDEIYQSAQMQEQQSKMQWERMTKLVSAGSRNEADQYQLESQLAQDELTALNAKNSLQLSYLTLWQLLDMPYDTANKIEKPAFNSLLSPELYNANDIYADALKFRSDIKSAQSKVRSAELGGLIALGGRSPRLTVFGNLSTVYSSSRKDITGVIYSGITPIGFTGGSLDTVYAPKYSYKTAVTPFSKQFADNFGQNFGFSLAVPIFNGFQVQNNIARTKINQKSANLNLEQTQNQLYKNIVQAVFDEQAALSKYAASMKARDLARKNFDFAQIRFDNGMLSYTDYFTAKSNLAKSETALAQAKYDLVFRMKIIDFYRGKTITLQ